ncbi:hypothetical protein BofuT4_P109440.1 [Botrytis cinerea T4]|uniref:Uncharacterized protein n=1 Tax=Botryotinia fuckeliana (strain T4) TaxID=999810 RepID=G2Y7F8_BOTF4|nr:hypothetical protein BofuT4_P109440.1 [Botrytis cinerea T4]
MNGDIWHESTKGRIESTQIYSANSQALPSNYRQRNAGTPTTTIFGPLVHPNYASAADCFLELVAHYFEFIDLNEVMQTDIEILRIKHRVLFEKTISLRWKPDNNQVHIGGFIGCRNSKSLEKIEITCTKWEDTIERSLSLSLSRTNHLIHDNKLEAGPRTEQKQQYNKEQNGYFLY